MISSPATYEVFLELGKEMGDYPVFIVREGSYPFIN
jgi:hypothetical protein